MRALPTYAPTCRTYSSTRHKTATRQACRETGCEACRSPSLLSPRPPRASEPACPAPFFCAGHAGVLRCRVTCCHKDGPPEVLSWARNSRSREHRAMASDRFELCPGKPYSVRGFTLEGIVELECRDNEAAQRLLGVLNTYVTDLFLDKHLAFDVPPVQEWLPV